MSTTTNKKSAVKGTVAAAAGIAVLLGGAGTFAMWNASGSIGTGSATTGHLTADFEGDTAWVDLNNESAAVAIDSFRLVPGDALQGTEDITVEASGDNLEVKPTISYDGAPLPETLKVQVALTGMETDETLKDGESTLTAKIDLTFDDSATDEMNAQVDLSKITINLVQVDPSAA